jgi:hypothetical protein
VKICLPWVLQAEFEAMVRTSLGLSAVQPPSIPRTPSASRPTTAIQVFSTGAASATVAPLGATAWPRNSLSSLVMPATSRRPSTSGGGGRFSGGRRGEPAPDVIAAAAAAVGRVSAGHLSAREAGAGGARSAVFQDRSVRRAGRWQKPRALWPVHCTEPLCLVLRLAFGRNRF